MKKFLGLYWEDVVTDDDGHEWARVCKKCVEKHNIPDTMLDDNAGAEGSLCDVLYCRNEQDYYIDFPRL